MKQGTLKQLVLYRYRYIVGYTLFVVALVSCLLLSGWGAPNGLTHQEQASAVTSVQLNIHDFKNIDIVNLPYRLLQKASISLFGLSQLSIKLPSLILALISGVGLLFLLRSWLRPGVAIIASLIAMTAGQFLIIAQTGTPTIMLFFWSIFLLLAATKIAQPKTKTLWWKLVLFIAAALSLYTPLSVYILVVMAISAELHPHLRQVLRRSSKLKIAIAALVALILLLPLILRIYQQPSLAGELGGFNDISWSLGAIWQNIISLSHTFFAFANPSIGPQSMAPLYGASALALIILGLLQLIIVDHHSARAYTLALWLIVVAILLVLQPNLMAISFVPLILLLAIGIRTLINEWYKLFPHNPYARISAILPLVILFGSIMYVGLGRYANSYNYSPQVASYFSRDLALVRHQLDNNKGNVTLVVPKPQQAFYSLLKPEYSQLTVNTQLPEEPATPTAIVASQMVNSNTLPLSQITRIVTSSYKNNSLRFYVYKTEQNVIIDRVTKKRSNNHARPSQISHEAEKNSKRTK